ncbi:hypothetical protein WHX56_14115 [Achromobacter veterisilvae]|uniref:Transcriptional regulator TetR C-terminal Proteobacteria type domain-containing protein n=1 Tax=Achromobacter veterisilvae TaxID=2069367 RepID=A0ABZ2S8I8_9BURK
MRRLCTQFRLLLAESMLGWTLKLAPKGADGERIVQLVAEYFRACKKP